MLGCGVFNSKDITCTKWVDGAPVDPLLRLNGRPFSLHSTPEAWLLELEIQL